MSTATQPTQAGLFDSMPPAATSDPRTNENAAATSPIPPAPPQPSWADALLGFVAGRK